MSHTRIALVVGAGLFLVACGGTSIPTIPSGTAPGHTTVPSPVPAPGPKTELLPEQAIPDLLINLTTVWGTDFSRATVDLDEILVGIPALDPRDLIRPIDMPRFESVGKIDWLTDQDPGVAVVIEGKARFYPLAIMTRHEIVNDVVNGVPLAVTYCPLCNTAVVFDRQFGGETLRFGVSGLLRHSDLIMWDDKTESLWQQVTGQGIVGAHAGDQLALVGSSIVRWADFAADYPEALAMSDDQGLGIQYGINPYAGYTSRSAPFLFFRGQLDDRYPALSRVVGVTVGNEAKAYPFEEIDDVGAVNDTVGGERVVVLWGSPDTADALDASVIANSKGVGTGVAYLARVGGMTLTFEKSDKGLFRDVETGSTWTILGNAVEGELTGSSLAWVSHQNELWFAWTAFFPDSDVWTPAESG